MVPRGKLLLLALLLTPACKDPDADTGGPDTATDAAETSPPTATGETPTTSDSSGTADPTAAATETIHAGETDATTTDAPTTDGETGGRPDACAPPPLRAGPAAGVRAGENYKLLGPERIVVTQDLYFSVHVGDVTGDGRPDILGSELDHLTLFAQTDDGSLAAPLEIPHGWKNPASTALLPIDADTLLDVAVLSDDGVDLLHSLGDGGFAPPSLLPDIHGLRLRAVDLDLDGAQDLVWLQDRGQLSGYDLAFARADGAGSFAAPVVFADAPLTLDGPLALGDVTGDGFLDLVSREDYACTNLVVVPHDGVSGPSPAGWTAVPVPGPGCSGYDVGDIDGDGRVDIAWQDDDNGDYDVRTRMMLGQPGGFGPPVELSQHGWGGPVQIADVNADGRGDVLSLHDGAFELTVILATAMGMGPPKDYPFPTAASVMSTLAVGDINCDGCPDVVSADVGGLDVFRGHGCGD